MDISERVEYFLELMSCSQNIGYWCFDMDRFHQHRAVELCVEIHTADGEGADGLAMIPFGQAHEFLAFWRAGLNMVLESHFQRGLHRR